MQLSSLQTPKIEEVKQRVREKILRRSNSYGSVRVFDDGIRKLEKYMMEKGYVYRDILKAPIQTLDDFCAWLNEDYAANTTIMHVESAKKLLKAMGGKITNDDFKDGVTLPKRRIFEDEKVSMDEARRIILGCKHLGLKTLLMLIKDTQARPIEILGLKLNHFDLKCDPPCLKVPQYLSKNDIAKDLFFTNETKAVLMDYVKSRDIKNEEQYLFVRRDFRHSNDLELQKELRRIAKDMDSYFRRLLAKPEFADLNKTVEQKGKVKRYKKHIYSFKKLAFTVMAEALGEFEARAIKGDKNYVMTYYKKTKEERARDYRKVMPKLCLFGTNEEEKVREQAVAELNRMDIEQVGRLLQFMKNGKNLPN